MILLELGLFFFVLLGSKLLLGAVAVYMLLPEPDRCAICDAELLLIEHPPAATGLLRLLRLERRWCMECRSECLARRRPASAVRSAGPPVPVPERRPG